jgi:DNA-binding GntR family transcriptional regulator
MSVTTSDSHGIDMIVESSTMTVETSTAIPLAEIQPQTLRHTVRMRIEEAIVQGVFRGGEKLNEAQLCRALGVSRGLLREALRELETSGVLVSVPYRGTFVKEWTTRSVQELYTLRSRLEEFAVELAVEQASDGDLQELTVLFDHMCAVAHDEDAEQMVELDMQFHQRLHQFAGHRLLQQTLHSLSGQTRMFIIATKAFYSPFASLEEAAKSHIPLLDALRARDAEAARQAMKEHIREVGELYVQRLQAGEDAAE